MPSESNDVVIVEQMEYEKRATILFVMWYIDTDAKKKIAVKAGFCWFAYINLEILFLYMFSSSASAFTATSILLTSNFLLESISVWRPSSPALDNHQFRKLIEICKPQAAVKVD